MKKTFNCDFERGGLADTLRGMKAGDVFRFPIEKHNSVKGTISNNLLKERAQGRQWSVRADLENKQTVVICKK